MIRRATDNDMPRLMELAKQFHYEANLKRLSRWEDGSDAGWANWLRTTIAGMGDTACFVDEDGGAIAGFATCMVAPIYWNPSILNGILLAIFVDSAARGSGAGGRLIDAWQAWAKDHGAIILAAGPNLVGRLSPKALTGALHKRGFRLEEKIYSRTVA